jgi:hypothetical protein
MLRVLERIQHIILAVVFLAVWCGNAFFWQNEIIGASLLAGYIWLCGHLLSEGLISDTDVGSRWWFGVWMLLSGIMIAGSAVYYTIGFTPETAYTLLLLSVPVALWVGRRGQISSWFSRAHDLVSESAQSVPAAVWLCATIIILCVVVFLTRIGASSIEEAVRSPWLVITPSVFLAFGIMSLLWCAQAFAGRQRLLTVVLAALILLCALSVAWIAYPLGYGFDSFIHKATETHIAQFGSISPKPFYYIGQYALVLFIHHAFSIPVELVDTLLVPLLAVLLLPFAWHGAASHIHPEKRAAAFTLVGLFLIPLASFIVTTPQGLANLWTLLLVLAAVPYLVTIEPPRVFALAVPALAALTIHPIAGLPALVFLSLVAAEPRRINDRWKGLARLLFWTLAALGCVVLPASFVANAVLSHASPNLDLSSLTPAAIFSALHLDLFFANKFNPLLDLVYLFGFNATLIVVLLSLAAAWHGRRDMGSRLRMCVIMAVILGANYVILSTAVDFSFLISYERQAYAERLIPLIAFFLSPLLILAIGRVARQLHDGPIPLRAGLVALCAALVTCSLYLLYPRNDSYETSHGFNVSASDINAVYAIDRDAAGASYVVLANQSVSAAAIHELGFAHYFGGVFFYPIPTGETMYNLFLSMNENPSVATIEQAAQLADSACHSDASCKQPRTASVYWVVNDYWWLSNQLIESGKQTADAWFAIDDGAIYVFRYNVAK